MSNLKVLSRDEVGVTTRQVFDKLKSKIGLVPNLYAAVANSPQALNSMLSLGDNLTGGEFSGKEVEAIALAVGQANSCSYCLSAHTEIAKMNGLTEEETIQIRTGEIDDPMLSALTKLAASLVVTRGKPSQTLVGKFFNAGYNEAALAELIGHVALNTFTNYINHVADTPIDYPLAAEIQQELN